MPDGSRDLVTEKSTLLESGFEELNGVDFAKGCFVGQELTARMKYRGLVRKRLLPVVLKGPRPEPGTIIRLGEREAGEMRSSIEGHGLALLRLDRIAEAAAGEHAALRRRHPGGAHQAGLGEVLIGAARRSLPSPRTMLEGSTDEESERLADGLGARGDEGVPAIDSMQSWNGGSQGAPQAESRSTVPSVEAIRPSRALIQAAGTKGRNLPRPAMAPISSALSGRGSARSAGLSQARSASTGPKKRRAAELRSSGATMRAPRCGAAMLTRRPGRQGGGGSARTALNTTPPSE